MEVPITQSLITFCEENFNCQLGEPKARMWFPHPDAEDPIGPDDMVCVTYVVYAFDGPDFDDCESLMIDKVLMPLLKRGVHLYWRLDVKFEVTYRDERCQLYTRIGVLDEDYKPVEITDAIKAEGEVTRRTED